MLLYILLIFVLCRAPVYSSGDPKAGGYEAPPAYQPAHDQGYPAGYPGAPGASYPAAPPAQSYPGAPPPQGYPGAPPAGSYPDTSGLPPKH